MNPEFATTLGDHRYDGRLTDRSAAGVAAQATAARECLAKLAAIDRERLSRQRDRLRILMLNLERAVFEMEELREYEWNPLFITWAARSCVGRATSPRSTRASRASGGGSKPCQRWW
jgi:uncharacterized protein (DUF885 family)